MKRRELERVDQKCLLIYTIVIWTLIALSVAIALWAFDNVPFMSGFLIALIPWNLQNWLQERRRVNLNRQ
jgi:hypothetical protein